MSAKSEDSGEEENENVDQSESSVSPEIFLPALESPVSDDQAPYESTAAGDTAEGTEMTKSPNTNSNLEVGGNTICNGPISPKRPLTLPGQGDDDDEEEDRSIYRAILSPTLGDVHLKREKPGHVRRKKISVSAEIYNRTQEISEDEKSEDQDTLGKDNCKENTEDLLTDEDDELDDILSQDLDTPDEMEDSILERLGIATPVNSKKVEEVVKVPPIPELTAAEERAEERNWRECIVAGLQRRIDMRAIGPFKKVLSHGGYMPGNVHNAIILFSACYLPERSRPDYDYLMDNLFLYVVTTLEALVAEEYVLVYLHGAVGSPGSRMPTFSWLKRCYKLIDRRLRKNLRALYLVHPTFWLKTIVLMTRPFISSKFSRKLNFVSDLSELAEYVPLDQMHIPERVKQ